MISSTVSLTGDKIQRFHSGLFTAKHKGILYHQKAILSTEVNNGIVSVEIEGPNSTKCEFNIGDFVILEDVPSRLHLLSTNNNNTDNNNKDFILFSQPRPPNPFLQRS